MKIRNIPYGYQYKNGSIAIQEKETETVKRIFTEYLNGLSLLKIAEHLNNEQIEYMRSAYVVGINQELKESLRMSVISVRVAILRL